MQHATHKGPCTIDGIDHPSQSTTRLEPKFLAVNPMIWIGLLDALANHRFSLSVSHGYRIKTIFIFVFEAHDVCASTKVRERCQPCLNSDCFSKR